MKLTKIEIKFTDRQLEKPIKTVRGTFFSNIVIKGNVITMIYILKKLKNAIFLKTLWTIEYNCFNESF